MARDQACAGHYFTLQYSVSFLFFRAWHKERVDDDNTVHVRGTMVAYTGKLVKYVSNLSPITIVLGMFGMLALVVLVPMYVPAASSAEETAADRSTAAEQAEKRKEAPKGENVRQRKSKRVE